MSLSALSFFQSQDGDVFLVLQLKPTVSSLLAKQSLCLGTPAILTCPLSLILYKTWPECPTSGM